MNKSIRILDLPIEIINKLEENKIFRIKDIINTNLTSYFLENDLKNIEKKLEKYKYNELKKEFGININVAPYQYLDAKYKIEDLDLSLRSHNALFNNKITTISQLFDKIVNMEIYNLENLGSKSIIQVMNSINEIVKKEKLYNLIPVYQKHHICDDLTIEQMGFSQGAITSLSNLNLDTLGKIREYYLNGKISEFFNYKTLKVIIKEFSEFFSNKIDNQFYFFKVKLIENYHGKVKINELPTMFNDNEIINIDEIIKNFINRNDIIIENDYIRLPYLIEKIKEGNLKEESEAILIERFNGETLQSVADKYHKTRERIRQIVRDRMYQISLFYEEGFVKEYNKYVWHPDVFKKVFSLNDLSFNVVKYLGYKFSFEEEYYFPEEYINQLIKDGIIDNFDIEEFKISLPEVFHPRIEIYGQSIEKLTKRGFLEYVIEHFIPNEGLHKFNIIEKANQVAKDNNLDYFYDKYIDIVTNTIQGLQNIRYYNYNKITENDINELKQILNDVDSVYSCTYFYKKYHNLMQRLDIRDGYELHFLLRRYFAKSEEYTEKIDFNRQPMIAIKGKSYSDVIIERWSQLTSPVNLDDFAEELIKNYGYHQGTLINIINITLGDYISLRVLYNTKPNISKEVLDKIKTLMKDEFYEVSELAKILKDNGLNEDSYNYFTNFWLNELGYKTHDVNYIIKNDYSSLKNVFFTKVLEKDTYQITEKDHQMRETTLILFIETLRQEYLAFPTKNNKLISMKSLESKGVKVNDLKNYVEALSSFIPKEVYFTYDSLLKEKYYLKNPIFTKVENYKLGKEIMVDLIRNIPGIKKTTKGDLFRISKRQTTFAEFINDISIENKISDKNILRQFVKDNYGITLKKYDF